VNSIANIRDIFLYFPEHINPELRHTTIKNFAHALKNCDEANKPIFFTITQRILGGNDEFAKMLKEFDGVNIIANSFSQSSIAIQEKLTTTVRNMITSSQLFRKHLGKNSEFLEALMNHLKQVEKKDSQLNIAGIIVSLGGYISNEEIIKDSLEKVLFPIIQNEKDDQVTARAFDCLMEASAIDLARPILLKFKTMEILQPFVDDENFVHHFVSCVTQAFLSSSDINQNNSYGSNPTSPTVISKILNVLSTFATTKTLSFTYFKGYTIGCSNILKAIGSLSKNEANMRELKSNGIVKKILELIQNRKEDLLETKSQTTKEFAEVVWVLSFDSECKAGFLSGGIVEMLKSLNVKDQEEARKAIQGALFILVGNQNQSTKEETNKGHVMISYSHGQKSKMKEVVSHLKSKGIPVWVDVEQMEGSILEKMAEAVEESSVIILFLSSTYKDSQACRTEAEYAYKLKKELICIMAEDDYQPRGWLGALLGNKLWYNPWKNLAFDEESFLPIVSQLAKALNQPKLVINQPQEKVKVELDVNVIQQSSTQTQNLNTQSNDQQVFDLLEKILNKMDGFEKRIEKMESQFQDNTTKIETQLTTIESQFQKNTSNNSTTNNSQKIEQQLEKIENRLEKMESQFQNNLNKEKMDQLGQQMNQVLETLEASKKEKKKNLFGK